MAELKKIRISGMRLHFADGSSLRVFSANVLPGPDDVKFLWFRRAILPRSVTEGFVPPRLDLGRFLRARSWSSLLRSLDRVTYRWPWQEREEVCREVAARIFARGPARVEALAGRERLDEQSLGDRLVAGLRRLQFYTLAPVPPTPASEHARRLWRQNIELLALRWSEPGEDDSEVFPRLEFLTDPSVQRLRLDERARRLEQRFGLSVERARQYADAVSPPDGPLAVFAYLLLQGHWGNHEAAAPAVGWREGWENTTWGCFLVERVLPNYPMRRALELRLRRGLSKLRKEDGSLPEALARDAALRAIIDTRGLEDYLNSYWGGPHFHGGKHSRTWSALLRRYQRQAVKESVEAPADPRYMTASDQIENWPAPPEEDLPDTRSLDLSVLSPAEREAVEEMVAAMTEGYGRHSKRGKSLKDWWGPLYPVRIRALSRARAKAKLRRR